MNPGTGKNLVQAANNLLTGTAGDVPSYPYLRALWLRETTSGGTVGTPTNDADEPDEVDV